MTKTELFLELAKPNQKGISRWVKATEFVDEYKELQLGNDGSRRRASSTLAKKYNVEFDKSLISGNSNDAKRQICKKCKETDKRWNAKNFKGNSYSFYKGDKNYAEDLGCVGCYQYDPVEYRKSSVKRIVKEASENTADFILKKLYGENEE